MDTNICNFVIFMHTSLKTANKVGTSPEPVDKLQMGYKGIMLTKDAYADR